MGQNAFECEIVFHSIIVTVKLPVIRARVVRFIGHDFWNTILVNIREGDIGISELAFKLLPGVYDIKVRDDSVPEKPEVNVKGVEVKAGETLEKTVEFTGEGVLEVSPVKAGKLFKAWVYIYRPGEEKQLTYKHSTEKRPASFKLLPGVYDIKVNDTSTKSVKEIKGVTIESGETQTIEALF